MWKKERHVKLAKAIKNQHDIFNQVCPFSGKNYEKRRQFNKALNIVRSALDDLFLEERPKCRVSESPYYRK